MNGFVSLQEAAELEGIDYETIKKQCQRKKMFSTAVSAEDGGRDRVLIEISSLSAAAQEKYNRRKRDAALKARKEAQADEAPWYVGIDLNWYKHNFEKQYYKRVAILQVIEKYMDEVSEHYKETTTFQESFAREQLGKSGKQLRRYLSAYIEGCHWAELCSVDGNFEFYKILCLGSAPQIGKGCKLTGEMQQIIRNLWADELYQKNNQSFQMLYDKFCDILHEKGISEIPSYSVCNNFCKKYIEYGNGGVKSLIKYGAKGFKNSAMIKRKRNTRELDVMEIVQGDAHTFDCWVSCPRPSDGKIIAVRPYLVGFIDIRSRCLVGWGITTTAPNQEIMKQVLIHMIYPKSDSDIYGVPKIIYLDNGKDFTAKSLTGRNRKEKGGFYFDNFELDAETKGFYHEIGIEEYKRALPYEPWSKGEIERFFRTVCDRFSKEFESYVGTLTGSRTSGKVQKDIDKLLEKGKLHSLDEFKSKFEEWLAKYHAHEHRGLKEQGEEKPTPIGVWENAPHYSKAAPPIEYILTLLGRTENRVVNNVGIYLGGKLYNNYNLGRYIGERVIVRYSDVDEDSICVYNTVDGTLICRAYTYEYIDMSGEDEEVMLSHYKEQSKQLKSARDTIDSLRKSYDDVLAVPELTGENDSIVAIPDDEQFRAEAVRRAAIKPERKKERKQNAEFVRSTAAAVYEEIKKLG